MPRSVRRGASRPNKKGTRCVKRTGPGWRFRPGSFLLEGGRLEYALDLIAGFFKQTKRPGFTGQMSHANSHEHATGLEMARHARNSAQITLGQQAMIELLGKAVHCFRHDFFIKTTRYDQGLEIVG